MVRYIGLDVHRREIEACVLDEAGSRLHRQRFDATREAIEGFASRWISAEDQVALEATGNSWGVVEVLRPLASEVVVSNPLLTKAIASAKVKTDKVDAAVLAQLLRCDYLPRVWEPDAATRSLRRLTSRRTSVLRGRTAAKNRIHAVLAERLIPLEGHELFGPVGRQWLAALELDEESRCLVDMDLRLIDGVDEEVRRLDEILFRRGHGDERVKLLMTLPGVSIGVAQGLIAAWGSIERFADPAHAASYLGLVPVTKQSGDRCYHGPITKAGNGHARSMMIQAAQHLATEPGPLGAFFRKIAKRKCWNVAVTATARKMAEIAFLMLKNREPYRYAKPTQVETKLAKLRVRATGEVRPPTRREGKRRPAEAAQGDWVRRIRPLAEVYEREGLPAMHPIGAGEQRALRAAKVKTFVEGLAREHLVVRKKSPKE